MPDAGLLDENAADDVRVIRRVLAGDREAFGVLVARYGRRVHDLARRMLRDASEAEDAVQQAFLQAFRALDRFDPRRPFRHWLLRIASNLCRNRLVAGRHRPIAFGGDPGEGSRPPIDPASREPNDPEDDDQADTRRVRAALDALPETYRLAAILRYTQDLPLEAISEITGDPVATVKTHLFRARAALKEALRGSGHGETGDARAGTRG